MREAEPSSSKKKKLPKYSPVKHFRFKQGLKDPKGSKRSHDVAATEEQQKKPFKFVFKKSKETHEKK